MICILKVIQYFDVFENLDPAKILSAPGLAWQTALKKDRSKIRTIN